MQHTTQGGFWAIAAIYCPFCALARFSPPETTFIPWQRREAMRNRDINPVPLEGLLCPIPTFLTMPRLNFHKML
jgi:hypothetical protein